MLSINECKRTLNKKNKKYSDSEIEQIRQLLYELAQIEYNYSKTKVNGGKSSNIHESFNG